jgi:hypothetical protein
VFLDNLGYHFFFQSAFDYRLGVVNGNIPLTYPAVTKVASLSVSTLISATFAR